MLALLATLAACTPEPRDITECARLGDPASVEDCRWRFLAPLADDPKALGAALAGIDDPMSRDLARLRLAIEQPARASRYCRDVETEGAREKCRQVLGRPHLGATGAEPR